MTSNPPWSALIDGVAQANARSLMLADEMARLQILIGIGLLLLTWRMLRDA